MPLAAYQALNLSKESEVAKRLFAHVDAEANAAQLNLTGDGDPGALSANLTPAMNAWLGAEVATLRHGAITSIESEAAKITLGGGVSGIVFDIEDDKLKRHRNQQCAQAHRNFYNHHGAELDELTEREREFQVLRTLETGREPRNPGRLLDFLIPLGIMIPEGFMNYKYFLDFIQLGIVALGSTIVVGAGIGWSAFMAGRFWKAYHFYMQPTNAKQKAKGIRMISIAMTLLLVSLLAVASVRYLGVMRTVEEYAALGMPAPNPLLQTAMLLFGNIVVFALGLAITYWLHDENPEYAEKAEKYEQQKKKVQKLRKKELEQLDEIDAAYDQSRERMQGIARLMNGKPGQNEVNSKLSALGGKDNEVCAVLQEYRSRLCGQMPPDMPIQLANGQPADKAAFAALPINLYRC